MITAQSTILLIYYSTNQTAYHFRCQLLAVIPMTYPFTSEST